MSQRGNALVEFSWLAILVMVPMLWLVLAVFDVQRSSFALTTAARSAGRAYVLAPTPAEGLARARQAVTVALSDQHDGGRAVEVTVSCSPSPVNCLAPGSIVTIHLATAVGLPWLPEGLGLGKPTFSLSADHTLPVGRFKENRSDPPAS